MTLLRQLGAMAGILLSCVAARSELSISMHGNVLFSTGIYSHFEAGTEIWDTITIVSGPTPYTGYPPNTLSYVAKQKVSTGNTDLFESSASTLLLYNSFAAFGFESLSFNFNTDSSAVTWLQANNASFISNGFLADNVNSSMFFSKVGSVSKPGSQINWRVDRIEVVHTEAAAPVPEPMTYSIGAGVMLAVAILRRRKRCFENTTMGEMRR